MGVPESLQSIGRLLLWQVRIVNRCCELPINEVLGEGCSETSSLERFANKPIVENVG